MSDSEEYYSWLRQQVIEGRKNAEEHFEKLLVSLNAGGLTLTVGFVKDLVPLGSAVYLQLLPITWILFVLSLILNLLSHRSTVKAADIYISEASKDNPYPSSFDHHNKKTHKYNLICASLFVLAVLTFLTYVTLNFNLMSQNQNHQTKPGQRPEEIRGLTFPTPRNPVQKPAQPTMPQEKPKQ
ncbi:hypothetical protein HER32_09290 [Hymenobacter sp. BT18]|uniref:hypothetical protein n=1 Tax=Hymenobacter sp. BT18 TaxID=2835648 RepID=UPI00143EF166|nr:hypothetical protein [Hymenobacter sp. BT18]QIX61360.1 hypothetical protein HER32_09290 [Hymenobacter sp. BT18]